MSGAILRSTGAANPTGLNGHGSVLARSRCAEFLALVELAARLGRPATAGLGMGSVRRVGSVGAAGTRCASSAYPRRTGLSELLKIRVSLVRFRPWPPLPSGVFRSHGLHLIPGTWLTLRPGRTDWGRARRGPDPVTQPSGRAFGSGADAAGDPLSVGRRQLIAVDRWALAAYYIGQMTYQKGR